MLSSLLLLRSPLAAAREAVAAASPLMIRSISSSPASSSSAATEPSPSTSSSSSPQKTAKGVNYQKAGSDPVIDTSSLPEWLSELTKPPPTAFELRRDLESSSSGGGGRDNGNENDSGDNIIGSLSERHAKQLLKLEARMRIKDRNSVKAKK